MGIKWYLLITSKIKIVYENIKTICVSTRIYRLETG